MIKIKQTFYYMAFVIYNEVDLHCLYILPLKKTTNKKFLSIQIKNIFPDFDNNHAKTEKINSC